MPNWISNDGIWGPRQERTVLYDKNGDPSIYEGPDRAATKQLKEEGVEHLGMHFSQDPDIIYRAHERKQTIEEFTREKLHPKEKREAAYKKNMAVKVNHKNPDKKRSSLKGVQTGGSNTAGTDGNLHGGFGSLEDARREARVSR